MAGYWTVCRLLGSYRKLTNLQTDTQFDPGIVYLTQTAGYTHSAMGKGNRSNPGRLLHSAWEKQQQLHAQEMQPEAKEPLDRWREGLDVVGLLGLVLAAVAPVIHLLPNPLIIAILVGSLALLTIRLMIMKIAVRRLEIRSRAVVGFSIWILISGITVSKEWQYQREHTPFCFGFFYRGTGPDGSIDGGREILGVANATKEPARNVTVNLLDLTHSNSDFAPLVQKRVFIPVVYPLPFNPSPGTALVFTVEDHWDCSEYFKTEISFEPKDVADSEYQLRLLTENGDAVEEKLRWVNRKQRITVTRMRDGMALFSDINPPFDDFGGCLLVRPRE